MENLENYQIECLELKLHRKGNLLYHEGPLLAHFINSENPTEHYFYKWSDCNEILNRWLIFKITVQNLNSFFEGNLTLLELIQNNKFVYFIDLDTNLNEVNTFICPTKKIPDDYLPSSRSYFKENQYEKYALELKRDLQQEKKQEKENQIFEILYERILTIQKNQEEHKMLLNLIFESFYKKDVNLKRIPQSSLNKFEDFSSINSFDSATFTESNLN